MGTGKPSAEDDMTDGCGLINDATLRLLYHVMQLDRIPTAVQARVMGAKGLWLRHPTDRSSAPKIWIRPSQIKIPMVWTQGFLDSREELVQDPILDVLQTRRFKVGCHLSTQLIVCLSHGGVPSGVFCELLEAGLKAEVAPLLDWVTPDAIKRLWFAVYSAGNVSNAKLRRAAGGLSRSRGFAVDFEDAETSEGDFLSDVTSVALDDWVDEISGCPMGLHEMALGLLESNFHPVDTPILRKKLEFIVRGAINDHIKNYSIPVPMSLQAWIAPG
jgi:RNA-dependent RNA polymerase